ncbi:MAG: hypothetical protein RJA70_371 [Pseudomonadota bacterium]|jgi:excisionase family DNA binding protein
MADEILTLPAVAKALKVQKKTVDNMAQKGELLGFKVGGQWRSRSRDIDAWIDRQLADSQGGADE